MALQVLNRTLCSTATKPRALCLRLGQLTAQRNTHSDQVMERIGNREVVGFGWNGSPGYYDRLDYPIPPVRFQEVSTEICALREKEKCDWRKLAMTEKKALYRSSFCQTLAEIKAPTSDWKWSVGVGLMLCSIGVFMQFCNYSMLYPEDMLPPTFDEEHRQAQLKRIIALEVNPIQGLASKWDYERKRWK